MFTDAAKTTNYIAIRFMNFINPWSNYISKIDGWMVFYLKHCEREL